MKTQLIGAIIFAGFTNMAIAGSTPTQQEQPAAAPTQAAPVVQQTAQQTAPAAQQATPAAQQAAPTQAAPRLTARERRAQRRAQRLASGQWTRVARPAVQ